MEEKKCIYCSKLITRKNQKPGAFKKIKYCTRLCFLKRQNTEFNPMKSKTVVEKISGKNHYAWSGNNVKYFGLHSWVRKYSKLDIKFCSSCGVPGKKYSNGQWSIEYSNVSGKYKRTLSDWVALCRKCHRKFDNSKREYGSKKCVFCDNIIYSKFLNYCKVCKKCKHERHKEQSKLRQRRIRAKARVSIIN